MKATKLFLNSRKPTFLLAFFVFAHCLLRAQDTIPPSKVDSTIQKAVELKKSATESVIVTDIDSTTQKVSEEKTKPAIVETSAVADSSVQTAKEVKKNLTDGLAVMAEDSSVVKETVFKALYGIGLNGGTNGAGLDFYYKFHKHFSVRVGFNYLAYKFDNKQFSFTTTATDGKKTIQTVEADFDFNMNNASALVEYSVGHKDRLRFVTGFAFYPKKSVHLDAKLITGFKINDAEISGEDLGSGGGTLFITNKVSPYLGMGIGRLAPRKRINFSLDLGAYYLGNYDFKDVVINPGLFLEGNKDNAPIIARNLNSDWRNKIFPVFNVRLGIRLNK